MEKPNIILVIVVTLIAFLLGVTITFREVNAPMMRRLLTQQDKILELQNSVLLKVSVQEPQRGSGRSGMVDNRLEALEQRMNQLAGALNQGAPSPMPMPVPNNVQQPQAPAGDEYTKIHNIPVGDSPVKGKKDAQVTIVEFIDFQCPFCSRFHPVINEVLAAYPDKVNFVLKHFPLSFHAQARPAAKAAFAAGEQGKYWEMVELLLENNKDLSEEKFADLAKQMGLNVEKFKKDLVEKDEKWEQIINGDMFLAQQVEFKGTPTYYINGRKTMARDLATYKKEIDAVLKGDNK